ncbi:MAG: M56 family metallopeptidase [Planctomycetota bacterium]
MTWQATVLFAALAVMGFVLRNRSARFRYSLWTLMPIRLLLPPSLALITGWAWWLLPADTPAPSPMDANSPRSVARIGNQSGALQPSRDASSLLDLQSPARHVTVGEPQISDTPGMDQRLGSHNSAVPWETTNTTNELAGIPDSIDASRTAGVPFLRTVRNLAFACWLAIVGLLLSRLVIGYRQVRRWVADSVPPDEATQSIMEESCRQLGMGSHLSVRVSSSIWTPLVTGLFRPVILLPPAVVRSLNSGELKAVLIHELQHVVRRDFMQECALVLVQILYFFHPCVWLANRQLRRLREQSCDEATIAILDGQRTEYGSGFVKVAELLTKPTPQFTFGIVDSGELPSSRLRRILDPKLRIGRGISWSGLALIVLLGLVLIPSSARPSALADSPKESNQKQDSQKNPAPATAKTTVAENPGPLKKEATEVPIFGDHNVEPIEIQGQVFDVNSKPASQAGIHLTGHSVKSGTWSASVTTSEEGRFRVRLRVKTEALLWLKLTAISADSSQMAFHRFPWNKDKDAAPGPVTIQLVANRVVRLKVVDKSGVAIEKANAALSLSDRRLTIDSTQTGADGIAQFVIPTDERINAIVAWKNEMGLDYRLYELGRDQKADAIAKAPEFPEIGIETLVLDGASPVSVKVVDEDGKPLQNASVYPWLLAKLSQNDQLNLAFFVQAFAQQTNDDGITTFAWIPSWQTRMIQFWPGAKGHERQRGTFMPGKDGSRLEIILKKMVPIRGHVRDASGAPVAGANVTAVGAGYAVDHGREMAVTDKDGAYELLVPPDQIYLVIASAKGLASAPQTGFAVFKGKPVEGKDFVLRAATRIHGKLVDQETQQPIADRDVVVYQYGQDLHSMKDVVLPNPENSRNYVRPSTNYQTQSDAQGQFELFVGDGNFDIRPPQQETVETFQIAGESERQFVVKTKLGKPVELIGTVRDESTNLPLAGTTLFGVSRSDSGRNWQATTTQNGEFRVMQFPAATYVYAVSADKKLAAIVEVKEKQLSAALNLQPVGTARGRLLIAGTNEPWSGQAVLFRVKVPNENSQLWSNRFGGSVTTAADGTFELTGLVPGRRYDLEMEMDYLGGGSISELGSVLVQPGEATDIGDVSPPPSAKLDVLPTLKERIAGAFNIKGTPLERYTKSKDLISLVNQHLLIVFGNPEDSRIHSLMQIRFEYAGFATLSDEFLFMAIPTAANVRPEADKLAASLQESLEGDRSEFLLVVLNSKGEKVGTVTADQLLVDGRLSREKLFERLRKYYPQQPDARQLLDKALAEAKQQNKRVLVQETATWCGPCHRLSRFLMANRVWEKDYIWIKMDHRYMGVRELMAGLRGHAEGGIPWCTILDSNGEKLATSNDLQSKEIIGYPSSPAEQAHFEHMLKSTRLRLTDDEILSFIQILNAEKK